MNTLNSLMIAIGLLMVGPLANGQQSTTVKEVITVTEVKDAMSESDEILLLDVRTPEEYSEGHLPKATNIDFLSDDFQQKVGDLPRDEPVYLYCRSGNRSAKAANLLQEMGFKEIYDMEGGYLAWEAHKQDDQKR